MKAISTVYSEEKDGFGLQATMISLDNGDFIVVVTGGRDHIGAIALALPRPSLVEADRLSATSSILTMLGHREDELVKYVSETVAAATGQNVIVIAGVHYDGLNSAELGVLRTLWISLTELVIDCISIPQPVSSGVIS
ncbi:hypothetical protein KAI46_16225 [bacterium]|nr:hypothetical protein [bacterium]